jgi:hypothetical protein
MAGLIVRLSLTREGNPMKAILIAAALIASTVSASAAEKIDANQAFAKAVWMEVITRQCVGRETLPVYKKRFEIGQNALNDAAMQSGRSHGSLEEAAKAKSDTIVAFVDQMGLANAFCDDPESFAGIYKGLKIPGFQKPQPSIFLPSKRP